MHVMCSLRWGWLITLKEDQDVTDYRMRFSYIYVIQMDTGLNYISATISQEMEISNRNVGVSTIKHVKHFGDMKRQIVGLTKHLNFYTSSLVKSSNKKKRNYHSINLTLQFN